MTIQSIIFNLANISKDVNIGFFGQPSYRLLKTSFKPVISFTDLHKIYLML